MSHAILKILQARKHHRMEKNPKSSYPKMKIRHGGKDGELNVCYRT
jgi:hypothetical protein